MGGGHADVKPRVLGDGGREGMGYGLSHVTHT